VTEPNGRKGIEMSNAGGRATLLIASALLTSAAACTDMTDEIDGMKSEEFLAASITHLPNNFPILNGAGFAAAFSTSGSIDFTNEFNTPQGTNGRSCGTCHFFPAGWGIRPIDATAMFLLTDGTHPLFNIIDANTPTSDVSTVEARWASYSMLRQGKFLRLRKPPAAAEFDVIAANDPFNFGTTANLLFFRTVPPTANFRSHTVMWDGANTVGTDLRAGLVKQARGNVTGAQQGMPATDAVINAIVDQEMGFSHAQIFTWAAGRLDAGGARGGPENASMQTLVAGRFDLYDAWIGSHKAGRAQIARGQEIFNSVNPANGRSCNGCHNAANNGQNVSGTMFNIGTSDGARAKADMAIYTLKNKTTGEEVTTTDPGKGFVTGLWSDVNRFKTPNVRGLAARGSYFHNGIAATLLDVVRHYEAALGFVYTAQQEADLVAFLNAL
jgi:cytochrome c peroxidase